MMQDVSLAAAFGRLLVVAVLMAVVLLVLRRISKRGRNTVKRGSKRAIELVDRQPLGKTQSVAVLRVHDYTLVVGVTEQRVELLGMLESPRDEFVAASDDQRIDLTRYESARHDYALDDGDHFFERLRERSAR